MHSLYGVQLSRIVYVYSYLNLVHPPPRSPELYMRLVRIALLKSNQ